PLRQRTSGTVEPLEKTGDSPMSDTNDSTASVATERGARYGKQLVSHLGRITPDRQMARGPSPLPHALHPHLLVVAQPGRAMVRAIDRPTTTPRRAHLDLRAGKRHPRLDHHLESGPQTIRLDQDRRRHPRTTRVISSSNSWRNTPGALVLRQPAGQSELGMSPSVRIYRRIDFILGAG